MKRKADFPFLLILVLSGVYLCSWRIQSHLLLHFDVSWLTHAAQQLVAGGNYINNFLETNPPLILYLYTPLVFLKQFLGVSVIAGTRLYIFTLATVSLVLCSRLLTAIFAKKDHFVRHFLLFILALNFLIFPLNELGQRENLTVIFIFPYLLLLSLRLQGKDTPKILVSCLIGLMAGIGFCIKPYFLLPLGLLELYFLYQSKHLLALFKPELLSVAAFICFYLIVIGLLHQDYIHQIIPLVAKFYYQRHQKDFPALLSSEESVFNYFVILLYLLRRQHRFYPNLCNILLIATQGFWLVYLGQRMGWYYHALPFQSLALTLATLLFLQTAAQKTFSHWDWLLTSALALSFMAYYYFKIPYLNLSVHASPIAYYLLFFMIVFPLFYIHASYQLRWKLAFALILLFSLNFRVYHYLILTAFYPYLFIMTASLMVFTAALLMPAATSRDKARSILLSVLGLTLFGLPAYRMTYLYHSGCSYKTLYTHLIEDMKKFTGQKVIYLSNASEMTFPNIDYSGQLYSSRFWSLIWLPAMKHWDEPQTYPAYFHDNQAALRFYINALICDFQKNEPQYVFVDKRSPGYYYAAAPDYIQLFSLNPDFKRLWTKYHYRETLENHPLYKLDVYQREG